MGLPPFTRPTLWGRVPFTLYDVPIAAALVTALWAAASVGSGMTEPASQAASAISLEPSAVPYYVLRSIVRMFVAYGLSLVFAFTFGQLAVHHRRAERIIIPAVDILQSLPVLGFLAITVNFFMSLFPGSMMGMELAAIFAIFTSQAWNLLYAFYQSARSIPRDLQEAATSSGLTAFQRFAHLEVPYAMNSLVWNSMVSFGGGWFFLAASEAITVLDKDIRLPGIGSYLATAVAQGNLNAVFIAIGTFVAVVVVQDLVFFRPLLAWAQRFQTGTGFDQGYESYVLTAFERSRLVSRFGETVVQPLTHVVLHRLPAQLARTRRKAPPMPERTRTWLARLATTAVLATVGWLAVRAVLAIADQVTTDQVIDIGLSGFATLARVAATVVVASLIWVPLGTAIGLRRSLAFKLRPIIQLGAAFPANLMFPLMVLVFAWTGLPLTFGSVLLMVLANQWYILFNVIIGAMAVPEDLSEAASAFRLNRWQRFRHLILPIIFPYWVTGALTAAGGAWNASIITEVAGFGTHQLETFGLGSTIARATHTGDWPTIILSILWMGVLVVVTNRMLWRRLYVYAEEHLKLD